MLANNRTPNETARAEYEINSINTSIGTRTNGVPDGMKYEKNFTPWIVSPSVVTPMKIITDNPIDTITDVVTVTIMLF